MAPDLIAQVIKHGGSFAQTDGLWFAKARERGRKLPMVIFQAPTQAEAAALYVEYFERGAKPSGRAAPV